MSKFKPLILSLLFLGALAWGFTIYNPATIGNVVRLGVNGTGSLPTSAVVIRGGLFFDDTTNSLKLNDGTAWFEVGVSGATGSVTLDGGPLVAATCELDDFSTPASNCAVGADCLVGRGTGQPTGLSMQCWVESTGVAKLQVCNLTALAVAKKNGAVTARCINP